jgi:uncharacterized protein
MYAPDMKPLQVNGPIKWKQICELGDFLLKANEGRCLRIDELDGLFCALICGPETVQPSEFLPVVFGDQGENDVVFATEQEANHYLSLIFRLWNTIASTLMAGNLYKLVIFDEDIDGIPSSARWAHGFRIGMNMRPDAWQRWIDTEQAPVLLQPVAMLADQWSTADQVTPLAEPVVETLLANIMAGLPAIYALVRSHGAGKPRPVRKKSSSPKGRTKSTNRHVN